MTVSPILILKARAEALAILYHAHFFDDIEQAKAPLRAYAVKSGLVDDIGAAAAWGLIDFIFDQ